MHNRLAIGPCAHMASMQCLHTKRQEEILCVVAPVHMAKSSGHLVTIIFHYTVEFHNRAEEFEVRGTHNSLRSMVAHHCR